MTDTNHNIRSEFGSNVAAERARRGWSQQELADKADLSRNYLSRIERGAASPTVHVAARLSTALGVSAGTLIEGSGE